MKPGLVVGRRRGLGAARSVAVLFAVGALSAPVAADDAPKNLSCSFTGGSAWSYEAGVFQSKPPNPLSFKIENIDLEKQLASLEAAPGAKAGKLSVVRAINANHYLEVVNEGFLNLTTVYDKDEKTGKYPAVHSRHFGILGQPVFGQYTGFCSNE